MDRPHFPLPPVPPPPPAPPPADHPGLTFRGWYPNAGHGLADGLAELTRVAHLVAEGAGEERLDRARQVLDRCHRDLLLLLEPDPGR